MTFDLESLRLLRLSPTQYYLLQLLSEKRDINELFYLEEDLLHLENLDYVFRVEGEIILTLDSEELFRKPDYKKYWEEFLSCYPKIDGTRRLHVNKDKTRAKYISFLKNNSAKHSEVLKAIQKEKEARAIAEATGGFFPAWRAIPAYINNKHWESYLDEDIDTNLMEEDGDKI